MVEVNDPSTAEVRESIMHMFLNNYDMLWAFLYSQVENCGLVEEALQETTVYLCNHWRDYKPGTNFKAWIRTVARRRCQELIWRERRNSNKINSIIESAQISIVDENWDTFGTHNPINAHVLDKCLNKLPESHRKIIEMYYLDQKSGAEIAAFLNKSVNALYLMMSSLRKRIKVCMEQQMAEETT